MNSGQTISHYRITGQLGRGGMGVVYQAEDTKLDRTVAIKVLPPAALITDDNRSRFYREAKAAAQLSHPNIAAVYEIDEAVPSDAPHGAQPSPFIAMEYIGGGTLANVIAAGPMKLSDAVRVATEVAEALKAAHAKDIVHRDIKSSNVMLDDDDRAKVLDFGLAKTTHATMLTQMGSTLGTAAYMSPEQARGDHVDHRTDLWSLGVLMYEMVAGRLPFRGDYEQAIVYGIMNEAPEPLTAVRSDVPMELERIVTKLLSKDVRRRYQTSADLIADLESVDIGVAGSAGLSYVSRPAMTASLEKKGTRWLPYAVGAAALVAGLLIGSVVWRESPVKPRPMYVSVNVTGELGLSHPAISPDGRYIAYTVAASELQIYDITDASTRTVVENTNVRLSRFSPDGAWLVFEHESTGLSIVRVPDGTSARLTSEGETPSWIDNEWILYKSGGDILRISRITQERVPVWKASEGDSVAVEHANALPNATHALVSVMRNSGRNVGLLNLDSGDMRDLIPNAIAARYLTSGHIVFTEQDLETTTYQGRVFAQPFDVKSLSTRGPAVFVLPDRGYWEFGVNSKGDLVTTAGIVNPRFQRNMALSRLDPETGTLTRIVSSLPPMNGFDISDDGQWLVYSDGNDNTVRIGDVSRGQAPPLPQSMPVGYVPEFTQDGDYVYYTSGSAVADLRLYRQLSDGSRPPEIVEFDWGDSHFFWGLYNEDRWALLTAVAQDDENRAIVIVDTRTKEIVHAFEGVGLTTADLSPDGRWIAYTEASTRHDPRVYVVGLDGSGPWLVGTIVFDPFWSPDGRNLYVRNVESILSLPITTSRGVRVSGPETVLYTGTSFMQYRIDRATGDLLVLDRADAATEAVDRVDIVFNWGERLKEIAPAQ